MARTECKPECMCCGKTIDTDNEEAIKVEDSYKRKGLIHIECEEDWNNVIDYDNNINN